MMTQQHNGLFHERGGETGLDAEYFRLISYSLTMGHVIYPLESLLACLFATSDLSYLLVKPVKFLIKSILSFYL